MGRIIYNSNLNLIESNIMTYRIYILKNPINDDVFYVGKTVKELKQRLTGHLSSLNYDNSNNDKNEYIKTIIDKGQKPIIEEVEVINGTCYLHSLYASYREFHWMTHYINLGVKLTNHVGVKTDAVCRDWETYVRGVKERSGSYHYYYVGKTKDGLLAYDGEKMEEDGFIFEKEESREYYTYQNREVRELTYHPIYDDENPDYIRGSIEEM